MKRQILLYVVRLQKYPDMSRSHSVRPNTRVYPVINASSVQQKQSDSSQAGRDVHERLSYADS
jgi:hypothetical protein